MAWPAMVYVTPPELLMAAATESRLHECGDVLCGQAMFARIPVQVPLVQEALHAGTTLSNCHCPDSLSHLLHKALPAHGL
jgi:hypothetical protein